MGFLDKTTSGRQTVPRRTLIYGPHGVGKTTWCSQWPEPVLLPTEDGFAHVDVVATERLTSPEDVHAAIVECVSSEFKTVILDSVDWLESMIWKQLSESGFSMDFGKGNLEVRRRMGIILDALNQVRDSGKHILLVGHAAQIHVEHPNGMSWDQMAVSVSKHSRSIISEWCDEILFCEQEMSVSTKEEGFGRKRNIGIDRRTRVLHTVGKPAFQAKNRVPGLKERFDLTEVEQYVESVTNNYLGEA